MKYIGHSICKSKYFELYRKLMQLPKTCFLASVPLPLLTVTFKYGATHGTKAHSHLMGHMVVGHLQERPPNASFFASAPPLTVTFIYIQPIFATHLFTHTYNNTLMHSGVRHLKYNHHMPPCITCHHPLAPLSLL